jgi:sugar transferase (PEP-CTERM/EpsH1 system associated)
MKILFVTARFPYPPFKGDQSIPFHRLKYMGDKHDISLLTFYENKKELNYLEKIIPYCKQVITIKKSSFRSLFNMLVFGLFSRLPFQVLYYQSRIFKQQLEKLIAENSFDILHVYMLRTAEYGKNIQQSNMPKILELIDSMQMNFQRRLEKEKWPKKWLFKLELKRLTKYEPEMVKNYDRSIVVSEKDKDFINHDRVMTIPLGIDTEEFHPGKNKLSTNKVIAFTGNMGYFPNKNAILWFLKNCWENIKKKVPGIQLIIAGKNPGPSIKKYNNGNSMQVLGYVDSVATVLQEARIAIAPLQSGSGMQFKILEAMACALPVVTTTIGLGTIPAVNKKSILVADDPNDFAQCCINLLTDDSLAEAIGKKAMQLVQQTFTWEKNIDILHRLYKELLPIKEQQ